ncbi:MAG: pyruvate kinase [Anaerolineae bacterium]
MHRTRIVVTLGPASGTPARVRELIEAGMDVARLNFSHGTHAEQASRLTLVRSEAAKMGRSVAVMQDLQGPKIRTGPLQDDRPVILQEGRRFTITTREVAGTAERVSTTYQALPRDVQPGDRVLISDGLLELRVIETDSTELVGEVVHGGELKAHQGINLPGVAVSTPAVTEKDMVDLRFGLAQGVDYVAVSFVRKASDLQQVKDLIAREGYHTPIVAKLEKPEAVDDLDAILRVADAVMVARGDMGVEMAAERVPVIQKEIIRAANRAAVPVITATQMLQSMIDNPRPTRAEVSDVANAILDGSDAVMLSGESAIGQFPVESVQMMCRIAEAIEGASQKMRSDEALPWSFEQVGTTPQAIAAAVASIVRTLPVRAVAVLTKSGNTARHVAHHRPDVPILAFTPNDETYRRMSLFWGVTPIRTKFAETEAEYSDLLGHELRQIGYGSGDMVVVTGGHPIVESGPTNFIKILVLG